ncbi:MAG: alpha/beta hydrolase [Chloroflexi bacterium]|nr:alpha/beta hydrolase [Chloroflexota bacterium]
MTTAHKNIMRFQDRQGLLVLLAGFGAAALASTVAQKALQSAIQAQEIYSPIEAIRHVGQFGITDNQLLDLGDVQIHYTVHGAGAPLILLHGFGGWLYSWRHNIPALARHYRVYALDLPGFGFSSRVTEPVISIRNYARWVRQFMDHLDIGPAVLAGNSMGGRISIQVAYDEPERVRKLVLITSQWETVNFASYSRLLLHLPLLPEALVLRFMANPTYIKKTLDLLWPGQTVPEEVTQAYCFPLKVKGTVRGLIAMSQTPDSDSDIPACIGAVQAPALLIWGDKDVIFPPSFGHRLTAALPAARYVEFPGAGHVPNETHAAQTNAAMLDFLAADMAIDSRAVINTL